MTTSGYYLEADCSVEEFSSLIESSKSNGFRPSLASQLDHHIPVYNCVELRSMLADADKKSKLMIEWMRVLQDGAGVLILQQAYEDTEVIDKATVVFNDIIVEEQENTLGDHFAESGKNNRVWNSHQKLCVRNPEIFAHYYANVNFDAVCEAWLGPHYQMTAQVNQIRPSGKAQQPHRDYHLGFQSVAEAERFPASVHLVSQYLTIQGAVAHCDMSIESGPTKLLPFSQRYYPGYIAWRRQDFIDYFEENYVQYPMKKGDAIFFNPATFHAGGANNTENLLRMANLIQVSSCFAYPMEKLDRVAMCKKVFPVLKRLQADSAMSLERIGCVIRACADGYPFPTNLDTDPPVEDLAPQSQAGLFRQALAEDWNKELFFAELNKQKQRRCA